MKYRMSTKHLRWSVVAVALVGTLITMGVIIWTFAGTGRMAAQAADAAHLLRGVLYALVLALLLLGGLFLFLPTLRKE